MRGTFQLMKSVNTKIILNEIRLAKKISRADIAKKTGISAPTVTHVVKELINDRLIEESHLGPSSGGRKPKILKLRDDGYYVIAVDAGTRTIEVALCNLTGDLLYRKKNKIHETITSDELLTEIIELVHGLLENIDISKEKIVGIGVAMHGVMDIERGKSYYSSNTGLKEVPIKRILEDEFSIPVNLENNSRALTLGEYWFGEHNNTNRFSAINIGRGLGSGLIIDNKLVHGAQYVAGEIGHTTISLEGEKCSCGKRGCLEMFVSGEAIARRGKQQISSAPADLTARDVYKYAKAGDQAYIDLLEDTAEYLSYGVLNLINTTNPTTIVLGGGVMGSAEFLMPIVEENVKKYALTSKVAKETKLYVGKFEEDGTLLGAAALWLSKLFL